MTTSLPVDNCKEILTSCVCFFLDSPVSRCFNHKRNKYGIPILLLLRQTVQSRTRKINAENRRRWKMLTWVNN